MSVDILGTSWDQCRSMVQYNFTSTETRRLVRMDSPGRPPRLSHSSWTMMRLNQWPGFVFLYHMPLNPSYWKVNRGPSMCALIMSLIICGLRNTLKVPYPGIEPRNWLASLLDPWAMISCEALFWPLLQTQQLFQLHSSCHGGCQWWQQA